MSRPEQEAKAGTGNEGNGERQFSMPRTPGSLIQHSPHSLHSLHSRQTSEARETWPQSVATSSAPSRKSSRSEEHTSELQSLMRSSYAVFCLKKKRHNISHSTNVDNR